MPIRLNTPVDESLGDVMADDDNWTERELLIATATFLKNLSNYLTISGVISPDKLRGIVEISSAQLDKEGVPRAANALSFLFQSAQTGEIDQTIRLLKDHGGSA